jgi:uncharacterized membrane protein
MIKRITLFFFFIFALTGLAIFQPSIAHAQDITAEYMSKPTYYVGKITEITSEVKIPDGDRMYYSQLLKVRRADNGELIDIQAGSEFQPLNEQQRLTVGKQVIIAYQEITPGEFQYVLADVYRLPILVWLAISFFVLVVLIARKQGVLSIVGMIASLFVLTYHILPQILAGQNPIIVSFLGCAVVAVLTVYLSHGISRESHLALFSMLLTLCAVSLLSWVSVHLAYLVGLGSEEAYFLQFGPTVHVNLQGLLLGGIMLGTLGVLDDITIAQVSVVTQLKAAKPDIDFGELYSRSISIGKDHVASLVNTLILAYAGSSLPLFLLFTMNQTQPLWVAINGEMVAEEIVRTLSGSIGLVLAVPLTTLAATFFAMRAPVSSSKPSAHSHHHHKH